MRPLALFLASLYPRQWRVRYGDELVALLQVANLTWRDVLDLIAGAAQMHLRKGKYTMRNPVDNSMAQPRVINLASRDIPHGHEVEAVVEYTRGDGSKTLVRQFCREVDFGGSYVTLNHVSRDSLPAQTFVVSGTKGEVADGFRTDRTELLVLHADGTMRRTEQTVKTSMHFEGLREKIRNRVRDSLHAGMTPGEAYQDLLRLAAAREDSAGPESDAEA
jgi:hypothetical protein